MGGRVITALDNPFYVGPGMGDAVISPNGQELYVATVFEVSRRHRLGQVLNARPDGVVVHLIPTGEELLEPPDTGLRASVAEQQDTITRRIDQGYHSACAYLDAREGRRAAVIRAKARQEATAEEPNDVTEPDRTVSPLVAAKLDHYFTLFDRHQDGIVSSDDITATADRVATAFGHQPDAAAAMALRQAYEVLWKSLCAAAGVTGRQGMAHATFTRAVITLTHAPDDYDTHVLPVTTAILTAADRDDDDVLNPVEIRILLEALGVPHLDARTVARRMDTNGDGVIGIDELDEAFRDYFTSDETHGVGDVIFGRYALAPPRAHQIR
jgi:Ca2+-binding EF-hand superfamily protein